MGIEMASGAQAEEVFQVPANRSIRAGVNMGALQLFVIAFAAKYALTYGAHNIGAGFVKLASH